MSSLTTPETEHAPAEKGPRRLDARALGVDALVVAGYFVVAGLLGAVLWWLLTDLPHATKTADGVVLDPVQLTRQVSIDGWYFAIAAVGGVLGGAILTWWRSRDAVATVLLVVLGAGLAAYLMVRLGLLLGPDSPETVLEGRSAGATADVQLALSAPGMAWVWPLASALGSLVVLWGTPNRDEARS